jgi:hypothetical protein
MLQMLGATVDPPLGPLEFNGIPGLRLWPRVAWSPLFAATFDDLEAAVDCARVRLGSDTALVIRAPGARVRSLDLRRGALAVEGQGEVVVEGVVVDNEGWEWRALRPGEAAAEEESIRRVRGQHGGGVGRARPRAWRALLARAVAGG